MIRIKGYNHAKKHHIPNNRHEVFYRTEEERAKIKEVRSRTYSLELVIVLPKFIVKLKNRFTKCQK